MAVLDPKDTHRNLKKKVSLMYQATINVLSIIIITDLFFTQRLVMEVKKKLMTT